MFTGHGGQSALSDGSQPAMLVLSGGEGYIDFRVGGYHIDVIFLDINLFH